MRRPRDHRCPAAPLGHGRIAEEGKVDRQQGKHARRDERDQAAMNARPMLTSVIGGRRRGGTPGSTTIGAAMIQSDRTV